MMKKRNSLLVRLQGQSRSVETPNIAGKHEPDNHVSLTFMVGEIYAHVQGASLKAYIAELYRFFELPDHQR